MDAGGHRCGVASFVTNPFVGEGDGSGLFLRIVTASRSPGERWQCPSPNRHVPTRRAWPVFVLIQYRDGFSVTLYGESFRFATISFQVRFAYALEQLTAALLDVIHIQKTRRPA